MLWRHPGTGDIFNGEHLELVEAYPASWSSFIRILGPTSTFPVDPPAPNEPAPAVGINWATVGVSQTITPVNPFAFNVTQPIPSPIRPRTRDTAEQFEVEEEEAEMSGERMTSGQMDRAIQADLFYRNRSIPNTYTRRSDDVTFVYDTRVGMYVSEGQGDTTVKELDVSSIPVLPRALRPFKIVYESNEEAHLRLSDSVIMVRSKPLYVFDLQFNRGRMTLHVQDKDRNRFTVPYDHPDLDMRSCPPGYVANGPEISYMVRRPERVFKQGLTTNTALKKVIGRDSWQQFGDPFVIMRSIEGRRTRRWDNLINKHVQEGLIHNIYLSETVGVTRDARQRSAVEYKGRLLGYLRDGELPLDDDDFDQSWIKADLREVNIIPVKA